MARTRDAEPTVSGHERSLPSCRRSETPGILQKIFGLRLAAFLALAIVAMPQVYKLTLLTKTENPPESRVQPYSSFQDAFSKMAAQSKIEEDGIILATRNLPVPDPFLNILTIYVPDLGFVTTMIPNVDDPAISIPGLSPGMRVELSMGPTRAIL